MYLSLTTINKKAETQMSLLFLYRARVAILSVNKFNISYTLVLQSKNLLIDIYDSQEINIKSTNNCSCVCLNVFSFSQSG